MAEFLSDGPSNQLLVLMLCPIVAGLLLVGFLFFSFTRRRRKSAMKLGIQPKTEGGDGDMNKQQLSSEESIGNDSPLEDPEIVRSDEEQFGVEEDLNLNILGGIGEPKMSDKAPSPADTESVDLAARLGGQPDQQPPPVEPKTTVAASTQTAEVASVAISPPEEDTAELLRLLCHPQTGQLIVEVAGQRYNKLTDITDREVGQYILELAANFLAFTNGVVATEAGVKSVYLPKVKQTPKPLIKFTPVTSLPDPDEFSPDEPEPEQQKPSAPLVPPPSPEAEAAFMASLQDLQPAPPPPSTQSRGFLGLSRSSSEQASGIPQFNLAGEINKIVQARLLLSSLAATTHIEILSDPSGGIRIKVNGQIYTSPDDLPDPDVKTLIKDSIKQWERS